MNRTVIAVADATRARLFTFEQQTAPAGEATQMFHEEIDLVHPARRMRPSELFSDSRPGSDRASSGRGFGLNDHRDASVRHMDREFAADIADEVARLVRAYGCRDVILAASPSMLGLLRQVARPMVDADVVVHEIDRDLVRLSKAQLHDLLSTRGLLPERERITGRA